MGCHSAQFWATQVYFNSVTVKFNLIAKNPLWYLQWCQRQWALTGFCYGTGYNWSVYFVTVASTAYLIILKYVEYEIEWWLTLKFPIPACWVGQSAHKPPPPSCFTLTSRCRLSVLQEQYAVCNEASNIKQCQQGCIRQFANPVEKNFKSPDFCYIKHLPSSHSITDLLRFP